MLSDTLRTLVTKKGMTQKDIAKELGLIPQRFNFYVNGSREPDLATLVVLADYFSVSVDFLLEHKKTPTVIDDGLAEDERQLIENCRLLNTEGQEKLLDASDDLVQSGKYKKHDTPCMGREA